jgi:chaperonin cofactor prefoldin
VDWTPREVYELREKAERYRLEANALMMQRDRLAEALRELCETLLADKPRDITELLNKAGDALAAAKL